MPVLYPFHLPKVGERIKNSDKRVIAKKVGFLFVSVCVCVSDSPTTAVLGPTLVVN